MQQEAANDTSVPSLLDRRSWGLLPSERILALARPEKGVSADRRWALGAGFFFVLSLIFGSFAALVAVEGLPEGGSMAAFAVFLLAFAIVVKVLPAYLVEPCEYLVTSHRVIWKRGRLRRSVDRMAINYGRILWHRSAVGVGHLEMVRAAPFGPLSRKQRVTFQHVRNPDRLLAIVRGEEPGEHCGNNQIPLAERLGPDERVHWGGHPEGWLIGFRELAIGILGFLVVGVAINYGLRTGSVLVGLEDLGLAVRSWTWAFFFLAIAMTWVLLVAVGAGLVWYGIFRTRALGQDSEYLLTDQRLLIRRGRTELSVERRHIVDLATSARRFGRQHLFLVLDGPGSRALDDSGALGFWVPARDQVAPVLYDLAEVDSLKIQLFGRRSSPSPLRDAA